LATQGVIGLGGSARSLSLPQCVCSKTIEEGLATILNSCPPYCDHGFFLAQLRSANITAQTDILSRFDSFLVRSIKIPISFGDTSYELLGIRSELRKHGFRCLDTDEFLSRREYHKLRPLLDDCAKFIDPVVGKKGSGRRKGRLVASPLLKCFLFSSLTPNRPSFFSSRPLWVHHVVSLSQAVSTAFESLSLPLMGNFLTTWKTPRVILRKGSSVRGLLCAHYYASFDELGLPYSGDDVPIIGAIKSAFYKFLVKVVHRYQINAVIGVVGSWPKTRTFTIIPNSSWRRIISAIRTEFPIDYEEKLLQLAYCISSSKSICEPVSSSFITRSLENHRDFLCEPEDRVLPDRVRDTLVDLGHEFGRVVAEHYRPGQTVLPNSSACFELSRKNGGLKAYIERCYTKPPSGLRCEPLVIGLFGPPGSGKSTFLHTLLRFFLNEFGLREDDTSYYFRNPHLDHWDGYTGQPITIIDDFGQDLVTASDLREFDQMVSCATFYPPMAHLDKKGIRFTSQVILITSNLTFGQRLIAPDGSPLLADPVSVWRRIHLPYLLMPTANRFGNIVGKVLPNLFSSEKHSPFSRMVPVLPSTLTRVSAQSRDRLDSRVDPDDVYVSPEFGSHPSLRDSSVLFYRIIPDFSTPMGHLYYDLCTGLLASAASHLPSIGDLPKELDYLYDTLKNEKRSSSESRIGTVMVPTPGEYNFLDYRNTGLSIVGYSVSFLDDFQIILRESLELLYNRRESHYLLLGVWPQVVVDEHIDFSFPDYPDADTFRTLPRTLSSWGEYTYEDRFDLPRLWKSRVRTDSSIPVKKVYYFPSLPSWDHPPKVKAVGLSEALKCRVITVPEGRSRCLKPFQMALHKALSFFPQFSLTHSAYWDQEGDFVESTSIRAVSASLKRLHRHFLANPSRLCLSGDYFAATDNFIIEVSQVLLSSILDCIPHIPTREWCMWEISPALISYPFGTYMQCRGQRMGSILSFPLLCLANEALCRLAGFDPGSYLINGDDLAASVTREQHDQWYRLGSVIGLEPNEKYFISSGEKRVIWINSQLFSVNLCSILPAGKLSCMVRKDKPLAACLEYLERYYGDGVLRPFCRINKDRLLLGPRSPFVPVVYGGLALRIKSGFNLSLAKAVYLYYLNQRIWKEPVRIPGTKFSICRIPILWRDSLDEVSIRRSLTKWRTREEIAEHQFRFSSGLSAKGYSRVCFSLEVNEVLDHFGGLVDDPFRRDFRSSCPFSSEFLGSRPHSSPWYDDFYREQDPLESIFISLQKKEGMDYRQPDEEAQDDLTWKEFRSKDSQINERFSHHFREWVNQQVKLSSLPPLDIFSFRFILCPNISVPLLCGEVFAQVENFILDKTMVHLPSLESYMNIIDSCTNDQSNPVFTKEYIKYLSTEPLAQDNFPWWDGLVIDQIGASVLQEETDLRWLLPDIPLDRNLPVDLFPDQIMSDIEVDHSYSLQDLD